MVKWEHDLAFLMGYHAAHVIGGDAVSGLDKPVVLLVEDEAETRAYLQDALTDRYRVIPAADGQAALEVARASDLDLVLADVTLAGMGGLELLAALRKDLRTRPVPVILFSGSAGGDARTAAFEAGADDYLVNPVSLRDLRARVAYHVEGLRDRRATSRRERELRLVAEVERKRWHDLWQQAPSLVAVLRGPDHVFELANPAYLRTVGRAATAVIGLPFREALPESVTQRHFELLDAVYRTGKPERGYQCLVRLARGPGGALEDRYLDFVYHPLREGADAVEGVIVQAADVTDLVKARQIAKSMEGALDAQALWLESVLNLAPVAIQLVEAASKEISFSNRAAQDTGGVPPAGVSGPLVERVARGERLSGVEVSGDDPREPRTWLVFGDLLPSMYGRPPTLLLIYQDLTLLKRMESDLRHAQKLEAIGKLAGGVAHEFNNLLTVVIGQACMLLDESLGVSVPEAAEEIRAAAERASVLTSQLLSFGRKQMLRPEIHSVNEVVTRVRATLGRLVSSDIDLRLELDDGLEPVRIDVTHLEQALVNLVMNARDAMPGGGHITIGTRRAGAGPFVALWVADAGQGITPEVRRRIFDPFFTTKPVGKGVGLGLSMTEGFVAQSGGRIEVDTTLGRGTTVTLYLPRVEVVERPAPRPGSIQAVPAGRPATILIVDDEANVLRMAGFALVSAGYRVLTAQSAEEALRINAEQAAQIDLMVTDVVMPRVTGPELVELIKATRPDMKVLYMSGYTASIVDELADPATAPFLGKPFTPNRLRKEVAAALLAPTNIRSGLA